RRKTPLRALLSAPPTIPRAPMPAAAAAIDAVSATRQARARRVAGLYALTPDEDDTARLVAAVRAALEGGAAAVQYRHKTASAALRRAQAAALARLPAAPRD